jgi:hypothetical protein
MHISSKKASQVTLIFLFVTLYFHYIAENNSFATISGKLTYVAIAVLGMLLGYFWYKEDRASLRVTVILLGIYFLLISIVAAYLFVF